MKSLKALSTELVLSLLLGFTTVVVSAADSKDILPSKQVKALAANAKTSADHMKLARHFAAKAAKQEAETGASLLGCRSGCNPAFACSCFDEQHGCLRATHQLVLFAPYVALVQPIHWEFSEGAARWRVPTPFSHGLISASPTILRV